jgi:hypothetical protein
VVLACSHADQIATPEVSVDVSDGNLENLSIQHLTLACRTSEFQILVSNDGEDAAAVVDDAAGYPPK